MHRLLILLLFAFSCGNSSPSAGRYCDPVPPADQVNMSFVVASKLNEVPGFSSEENLSEWSVDFEDEGALDQYWRYEKQWPSSGDDANSFERRDRFGQTTRRMLRIGVVTKRAGFWEFDVPFELIGASVLKGRMVLVDEMDEWRLLSMEIMEGASLLGWRPLAHVETRVDE